MKFEKINCKELNLDVKGQQGTGCWDDCYIGGHWELQSSQSTAGCNWVGAHWTMQTAWWQ